MSRQELPGLAADDPRPSAPTVPAPEECCGGGCDPCIYDRYYEALERYHEALKNWLERHRGAASDSLLG